MRFYDRQFCTRKKANSDVLTKFENLLNEYFRNKDKINGLPSVKYFANEICLSTGYFGDLIKKETGKTAQEYIQHKIISLSKTELINGKQNISEIAYSLGFQYPKHFIRLFKKIEGCTPGEFKERFLVG